MAQQSIRQLRQKTVPQRPDPRVARIQQIEDYWQQYPGAAPGGTGATGLLSNDAQGYSRLLNERIEHDNLVRALNDQGPLSVRMGRPMYDDAGGTAGDALEDVRTSMPWYVPPPPPPKQTAQPVAPQPPPPPDNRRAYEKTAPYDPQLGRARYQAGMLPGSLAALQQRTLG